MADKSSRESTSRSTQFIRSPEKSRRDGSQREHRSPIVPAPLNSTQWLHGKPIQSYSYAAGFSTIRSRDLSADSTTEEENCVVVGLDKVMNSTQVGTRWAKPIAKFELEEPPSVSPILITGKHPRLQYTAPRFEMSSRVGSSPLQVESSPHLIEAPILSSEEWVTVEQKTANSNATSLTPFPGLPSTIEESFHTGELPYKTARFTRSLSRIAEYSSSSSSTSDAEDRELFSDKCDQILSEKRKRTFQEYTAERAQSIVIIRTLHEQLLDLSLPLSTSSESTNEETSQTGFIPLVQSGRSTPPRKRVYSSELPPSTQSTLNPIILSFNTVDSVKTPSQPLPLALQVDSHPQSEGVYRILRLKTPPPLVAADRKDVISQSSSQVQSDHFTDSSPHHSPVDSAELASRDVSVAAASQNSVEAAPQNSVEASFDRSPVSMATSSPRHFTAVSSQEDQSIVLDSTEIVQPNGKLNKRVQVDMPRLKEHVVWIEL